MTWPDSNLSDKQYLKSEMPRRTYGAGHHGSSWGAYFNLVCIMAGSGLPFCLRQGGGILLIKCLYVDGKRLNSLAEVGHVAFGKCGRLLVNFFTATMMFGSSALFFILASANFRQLFKDVLPQITGAHWIVICTLMIWPPFVFMKTLKEVAILSFFGAFATVIMVFIVLVTGFTDLHNVTDVKHEYFNYLAFPSVLASVGFSFGGNSVFPHVEHSMSNRKDWPKVLKKALITVFLMYFVTAFVGYYVYGDKVESPILKTLPDGYCLTFAIVVITAHVLLTNPILLASLALEVEHLMKIDRIHMSGGQELLSRVAFRTILLSSSALVAVILPYFAEVITLLGAISNSMLIFVLPIVFNRRLFGGPSNLSTKLTELLIVFIGFMSCGFGTYSAIISLNEKINHGN
ncbi:hypothetical protein K493DRAFT_387366 [Basidiobolus meristosporus CBS 931.73]|uniref:Amino acid transporter transmembrane domain-containing protein n=1 Tax=Basidiobolus meristosporus CBS 931.73 TaxID=1314790 RepID=A0A1Y1XFI6_9FUNG|nr:hypothetical protein K493DRAFT_387366 [Basidiobolus meristosporus CBS 931.73]|eukprot:ORX84518.1 hypothetical protein K493DRAFT_387366 [Basidiobolus meristosporus CBS 931.73]